jgi:hypothetical protein
MPKTNLNDKFDNIIKKIQKQIDNIEKYDSNFKNDFELKCFEHYLINFNNVKKKFKINQLIFQRFNEKLEEFKEFMKENKNKFNKIVKLYSLIQNETDSKIINQLTDENELLILNINNDFVTFQYEENLKDNNVIHKNRQYDKNQDYNRRDIYNFFKKYNKNIEIKMNIDDSDFDLEYDSEDDKTPLNHIQKISFWYIYLKWILYNNNLEWNKAKLLEETDGLPIKIEHYDNLHHLITKLSNNKLNYNKLYQLNLDNPSDFPLENGGFDNLILNDKKKKNQYKNFIKELTIFKYTQFNAYHRDNLVAFGEALKLLEKKYRKLSLKPGNELILIDFYNKLILLIEVSMNEKTASQFFTNKFEINTLSVKKKDLTKISRKFDQIWIHDRGSIWGAKKGNDWLNHPTTPGTPGYASLRGFLMGLSRPMLIFKQKNNKNLDWNRFKHYNFIINYDSIPKNKIYTNSFIPNLKNKKTFYSESIKQNIDPMNATYADNFDKKDRSKSSSIHKSSPLSPLPTESSGLNFTSSNSDPKSDLDFYKQWKMQIDKP